MLDPLPGSLADLRAQDRAAGTPATPAGCGPEARAGRPAGGSSALPCQNSNNCPQKGTEEARKPGYKLRQKWEGLDFGQQVKKTVTGTDGERCGFDSSGRVWQETPEGTLLCTDGLSASDAKRAYSLRQNIQGFTEFWKHECCGFMTLTAASKDIHPKEFAQIWHDMRKTGRGHAGLPWVRSYVRVLEPQLRGSPHWHLCVATPYDLNPQAFDWQAYNDARKAWARGDRATHRALTRQYSASATPELRGLWRELRKTCERYGLGRSEFLPYRKEAGAVANYVGGYLESGLMFRRDEWKGVRRIEYDRTESSKWKRCGSAFGWVSPGAARWRERVGELARAVGVDEETGLSRVLGPRWGYQWRTAIVTAMEEEWRNLLSVIVWKHGGKMGPKPKIKVGADVLEWFPSDRETFEAFVA